MASVNGFSRARIQGLVQAVRVANRQQLVAETRRRVAANQATLVALTGREAPIRQYVDGSLGKPLDAAELFTKTDFDLLNHVVDEALKLLIERSPVGPGKDGHYRDDHLLFVNGVRRDAAFEVNSTAGGQVAIGPGDEVIIINTKPYARKIEGGARHAVKARLTKRRPGLSVQAPNGVYEISAHDLQARFGNLARITFGFRGAVDGELAEGAASRRRENRFPALTITGI